MNIEGAEFVPCTPEWVARHNACGDAIRQTTYEPFGLHGHIAVGHEHLMQNGNPVLWRDALTGQQDRIAMDVSGGRNRREEG